MRKRNILTNTILTVALVGTGAVTAITPALAEGEKGCGGAETSIIDCGKDTKGEDAIMNIIRMVIQIMTGGILVVATGAVVYGGILYSASGATPDNVKKAKSIWMNTVVGLIMFALTAAILNFIVPGGVF